MSDRWIRVLFALLPCGALVVVSMFWGAGAPFLLTFAGAFASIQLVEPYRRASQQVADFLTEAREQQRTAVEHAKVKIAFNNGASMFEGAFRPVGYSRAGEARARRRFGRIAKRWRRSFRDVSGRIRDPVSDAVPAAALPRFLYPRRQGFEYRTFVRKGKSVWARVVLSLCGLVPMAFSRLVDRIDGSAYALRRKRGRAEKLLKKVGTELIRARRDASADRPVLELASQWSLDYETPTLKEGWVFSATVEK